MLIATNKTPSVSFLLEREHQQLVARMLKGKSELAQSLDVVFHVVPGIEEFVDRLAYFLNSLPYEGNTLLHHLVVKGVSSIQHLGLSPITVDAHLTGYSIFVRAILSEAHKLLDVVVTNVAGERWMPLSGPLSSFDSLKSPLLLTSNMATTSVAHKALLRSVLLSHCTTMSQMSVASSDWIFLAD